MRELIAGGADVNAKDGSDITVLRNAAGSRNPEAVKLLLSEGAKLDGSEFEHACSMGRMENIVILLEAGADPSPGLLYTGKNVELVKFLLKKGANPNGSAV